jgi:hypothetical protein
MRDVQAADGVAGEQYQIEADSGENLLILETLQAGLPGK